MKKPKTGPGAQAPGIGEQDSAYNRDVTAWDHVNTPEGTLTVAGNYASGGVNPFKLGAKLGWVWVEGRHLAPRVDNPIKLLCTYRVAIRSLGPVQIGLTNTAVCVAEGLRMIWLARARKLWLYPPLRLPEPAPRITAIMDHEDGLARLRIYADSVARLFADSATPLPERQLLDEAVSRYQGVVRALTGQRCVDAAVRGIPKDNLSFAQGVSEDWVEADLIAPRGPDMKHALLVSLVLGLPENQAVPLIELGAQIEHRIPIVSRDAARAIWIQGSSLLARLCPEWWNRSYLCDWNLSGSIDRIFRYEYCRMLNQAWNRGTPLESTVGIGDPDLHPPDADAPVGDDDDMVDPQTLLRSPRGQG
jgi:hypothetical protein